MASFGLKGFLDDFGCKGLFYLHTMCRSVSIGSTSFLSVYQAITISPQESRTSDILYTTFLSVPDFLFVGIMHWASSYMVFILHRHKQWKQHMPRAKVSSRSSPDSRVTKTIRILVSLYACFHRLSCIFIVCLIISIHHSLVLLEVSALLAGYFPTVSPFLFLRHKSSVSRLIAGSNTMTASEVGIGVIFLSQTMVGVLDISYILHHDLLLNFSGCTLTPKDWILMNLTIANVLNVLCK
ncbi:hypothetical protein A6R68_09847 [Neotoma lepida]|uniref:Vomeronasal type-1 receptor n=1 Tax=Neotoma lepida TaxID=56216 RepID=A0A1A6FYN9_NEOLE|nr:hypothetical protein A6R68_09847 [Neotoma lepida]